MEYRFIHHWQYTLGEEESKILEAAIALSNKEKDESFFQEVVSFIARHTGVLHILIGLLSADKKQIHTCAYQKDQQIVNNITYNLQGTPCEKVLIHRFCYYPLRVSQIFPDDQELQHLQIESYLGTILLSETNEPLGLVTLMDTKSIKNPAFAEHLILVLSSGIEEELMKYCNAPDKRFFSMS